MQSPKCGNGNDPLDKAGALTVLELVLSLVDDGLRQVGTGRPKGPGRRVRSR